jgi:lipopolysaccharide/colanic/teichoic acid biosynthesis glycosyltransferase
MHFDFGRLLNKEPSVQTSVEMPVWKRAVDITCSLAALPVLALFTVLTAIVMKFTSPGPVFFRQERVGFQGRRFQCYKFRTMHVGADRRIHQTHWTRG